MEVNVTGTTYNKEHNDETQSIEIAGFLPARTYEVSLALMSGNVRGPTPHVFQCLTDPRGESNEYINYLGVCRVL